ncbi:MAG: hypothetical protein A2042_09635 [Candidatus Schekmanbacteria bacterium GWA2_38_11]|uniref:HTH cro/C1-type domain-containing protein n=1 Tax=Candidatus Schekmanbacteria bacterium GWA2_38_11 TaxID=1817876 RepID=A0A1F7RFB2_9BACT|nr:MAG: hypothetical protein A2042_09635 [Candidatus Schekmanbacteria bacterium GWA2_38_11]
MMKNLKLIRIDRGLTQQGLAAKVGTIPAMISNLERGVVIPSPNMVMRLSKALDVDPGLLTACEAMVVFNDKK